MRVAPWSWRCKSSISYYFTFALCNRWQPIAINVRCILHDNSVAALGQPVCVYRSSVVLCGCGNWVVYIVWAFVSVLLINCCWLLINFKSWSKNANRFEQSIFTTAEFNAALITSRPSQCWCRSTRRFTMNLNIGSHGNSLVLGPDGYWRWNTYAHQNKANATANAYQYRSIKLRNCNWLTIKKSFAAR